jgi:hypothetical protein
MATTTSTETKQRRYNNVTLETLEKVDLDDTEY